MNYPYSEFDMCLMQELLAGMFQIAVQEEHMDIDAFANKFLDSEVCTAFETADPVFIYGKSENELVGIILDKEPFSGVQPLTTTPEYWVGWVLVYAQWKLRIPYRTIIEKFPSSELAMEYFPYHEMDISYSLELIKKRIAYESPLKLYRNKMEYSQKELSLLSGVPLRTIRAYEQGTTDIAEARGVTLYNLAKALDCTMEDLIA